jgi:serine protease DegQ
VKLAYAGFATSLNFGPTPVVTNVDSGSEAEKAGLHVGDVIQGVDGQEPAADLTSKIANLEPGATLKLKVTSRERTHEIKIKLAAREETQYEFADRTDATAEQIARRKAWERGDSEPSAAAN